MTSEPDRVEAVCTRCGAVNNAGAARCSSCGGPLAPETASENPYEPPKTPLGADGTTTFGTLGRVVSYIVGVALVILSGVIAFAATCFPIGLISVGNNNNPAAGLVLGFLVGLVSGGVALYFSIKLFRRVMRRKGEAKGAP